MSHSIGLVPAITNRLSYKTIYLTVRRGVAFGTVCLVLAVGLVWPPSRLASAVAEETAPATPEVQPAAPGALSFDRTPLQLSSEVVEGEVFMLVRSADGRILAASGGGHWNSPAPGFVRIWDLTTGQEVAAHVCERGVYSLSLSPDGRRVCWVTWNHQVTLREVAGREIFTRKIEPTPRVNFSPTGSILAFSSEETGVQAMDPETGDLIDSFSGDSPHNFWSDFSLDGRFFGTAGAVNANKEEKIQISVWNVATRRQVFKAVTHAQRVIWSGMSPDNNTLVACCDGDSFWLWDLPSNKLRRKVASPGGKVKRVAFSPDGSRLASGNREGQITLWNTSTWESIGKFTGHQGEVGALIFSPDGKTLTSGGFDHSIRQWDVATQSEKRLLQAPATDQPHAPALQALAVAYAPDGKQVAAAGEDGRIDIYNLESGKAIRTWQGHTDTVAALAYSPDGQTLASAGYDKTVQLWNPTTGESIRKLPGHKGWVVALAFSHDGQTLASGSYDRSIILWNPADGSQRGALAGHTAPVRSLAYSRDDQVLASGGSDRKVKLWTVASRQEQATLEGHEGAVRGVAFSPDGRTLASGGEDRVIKLWNVDERTLRSTLTGHGDMISAVAFAAGTLLSASWDHSIQMWDVDSAANLGRLDAGGDAVVAIAVAPDAHGLLVAYANRSLKLWKAAANEVRPTASVGKLDADSGANSVEAGAADTTFAER